MNKLPFESKNENITNSNLINQNNFLDINDKSAISFNKLEDKEFSQFSSKER